MEAKYEQMEIMVKSLLENLQLSRNIQLVMLCPVLINFIRWKERNSFAINTLWHEQVCWKMLHTNISINYITKYFPVLSSRNVFLVFSLLKHEDALQPSIHL